MAHRPRRASLFSTRWRARALAIGGACCAQHCAPRPADAVVWVGPADAANTATPDTGASPESEANGSGRLVWPNDAGHTANSDPWIPQNHDKITLMQPQVLLLDFANEFNQQDGGLVEPGYDITQVVQPLIQEHVDAFKVASQYQGYKNPNAPAFMQYQVVKIVDLRDGSGQVNSLILPLSNSNGSASVDYGQLNSQSFANLIGIEDTDHPGTYLNLCSLFEKGIINEVWGMAADAIVASDPPTVKFAEFVETKQGYDSNGQPISGQQFCTSIPGAPCVTETISCSVSMRFFDFNPGRGAGCHLWVSGMQWPQYLTTGVLPTLAAVGKTFFNFDFDQRFAAPFVSFFDVCPENVDGGACIQWMSQTHATSGPGSTQSFDFQPMSAGCGTVVFPPNATGFSAQADDVPVLSSCENYGLHNGADGADTTTPYTGQRIDGLSPPSLVTDCGGAQTAYLLESMPGLGTTATTADGTPMKNWWVYLFY